MLVYSFLTPGTYGGVVWEWTVDAYIQFLFERDFFDESLIFSTAYLEIYTRSFAQAVVSTVACFLIGFPTAYFIATRPPALKNMWVLLVTVPYWVNLLIRTISMLFLVRDNGPLNHALQSLGLTDAPIHIAYTNIGVGIGLVYSYLPFMVLPIYATIERFDFRPGRGRPTTSMPIAGRCFSGSSCRCACRASSRARCWSSSPASAPSSPPTSWAAGGT